MIPRARLGVSSDPLVTSVYLLRDAFVLGVAKHVYEALVQERLAVLVEDELLDPGRQSRPDRRRSCRRAP